MDIIKAREELLFGKTIYDMHLKVADYIRVSTDKDDQINSLTNQEKYFNDFISNVNNWTHVNTYKDEGISGTDIKNREDFLKMIEDARLGNIDLILTKEVSRFARNTIDSIRYTELLLNYGVIVFFISDNINTIYKDSEFRLTLMASMAQDEVRKLSERVKFGIKRSIKDGKLGGSSLYGYTKKNCKLKINKEEANIVRLIYSLYTEEEYGLRKICDILKSKNILTRKGNYFSDTTLKKMIRNPRYKGFYTANMSEVIDYKTHKRKIKKESDWIIYKDNNIPKIVDEKIWNRANNLLNERHDKWNKNVINKEYYLEKSSYTSKLICKEHNKSFIRCAGSKRKNNPVWMCDLYLRNGLKGCTSPILFEKKINTEFTNIFFKIIDMKKIKEEIINDYLNIINDIGNNKKEVKKRKENKIIKNRLLDLLLKKIISEEEYLEKKNKIDSEIEKEEMNNDLFMKIENKIESLTNMCDNVTNLFNIFIEKVYVSKIDNNRKHVNFQIVFNFNREDLFLDLFI